MNGPRPPLPLRVAEGWVACYTRGLPGEVRDARRAELRSDLFEHRQHAARRPAAAERRRHLLAWLFDWVVTPAAAFGVLLTAWVSTSPFWPAGALVVLFVVLAVLRTKLIGPASNETAYMLGVAPPDADPGRLRRLWGGLLASVLLLAGVRASTALLDPLRGPAEGVVNLAGSLASIGLLVSVLMLLNEYARRWRRQRRRRSGE